MKKLLLLVLSVSLIGCGPNPPKDVKGEWILPEHLKDCSFDYLQTDGIGVYVMRCPNSTTSTTVSGKRPKRIVVIDGQTYEKVEE